MQSSEARCGAPTAGPSASASCLLLSLDLLRSSPTAPTSLLRQTLKAIPPAPPAAWGQTRGARLEAIPETVRPVSVPASAMLQRAFQANYRRETLGEKG